MPKISIIMPLYNAERFIAQAIESVKSQTFTNWELILVNDGSTDSSATIINSYAQSDTRFKVINQENGGTGKARNQGAAQADARADYIIFLDADDCWEKDALAACLARLEKDPAAAAVHGLARVIDERGRVCEPGVLEIYSHSRRGIKGNRLKFWKDEEPTGLAVLAVTNVILTPGQLLMKKTAFENTGKFNTELKNAEDWDLWLRFTTNYNIDFLNKIVINYRQHSNNKSKTTGLMQQSVKTIYFKYMSDTYLTKEQRKLVTLGYYWSKWLAACLYLNRAVENVKKKILQQLLNNLKLYFWRA